MSDIMRSLSPEVFSPRPLIKSVMLRPNSKKQASTIGETRFSYGVSSDGIEIRHPQSDSNNGFMEIDLCLALTFPCPSGIDEIIDNNSEKVTNSSISAPGLEALTLCPLNMRRGKPLPRLEVGLDFNINRSNGNFINTQSPVQAEPYEVIEEIGNDSEGPCTLVKSRSNHQVHVVKSVRWPLLARGKPIEAKVLQDIFPQQHENIIRLQSCDLMEKIGLVQYHFEYCSGGDLHDLCCQYDLHNEHLPELFIWKIFLEISDALEFLHRGFGGFDQKSVERPGIVHRDIKPANIFLRGSRHDTAYPDAVVADFGNATFDFATYEPAGTYGWQGPEIPRKSPKGDVWGLGAVIHQMIHFTPPMLPLPFGVEPTAANVGIWEMSSETRRVIYEVPSEYSQELINVMLVALEIDHSKRASSSRLLSILKSTMDQELPLNGNGIRSAHPLAPWAFDHVAVGSMTSSDRKGCKQYYKMMGLLCRSGPTTSKASIGDAY